MFLAIFTALLSSGAPGLAASLVSPWVKKKFIEDPQHKRTMDEREQEHRHRIEEMEAETKFQMQLKELDFKTSQDNNLSAEYLKSLEVDKIRQQTMFVGIGWVDAISATVRPVVTYIFTILWLIFFFYFGREFILYSREIGTLNTLKYYSISEETFNLIVKGFWDMFANIMGYWFGMRDILRNKRNEK